MYFSEMLCMKLYEVFLKAMFQASVDNNSNKKLEKFLYISLINFLTQVREEVTNNLLESCHKKMKVIRINHQLLYPTEEEINYVALYIYFRILIIIYFFHILIHRCHRRNYVRNDSKYMKTSTTTYNELV